MKRIKALVLLSGGLDSMLAAKVLMEQGIKVQGLTLKSYFFGAGKAKKAAKELGIKLKVIDFSKEHLEMLKNPEHGYGKNMNPCIDCHLLMFKRASQIKGFDFVATGEVLGERPMSQNRGALELIEKESGLSGYLLRPLSAKLLKETEVEKQGLVDRSKLLDISGRSRKKQMEFAKKWGINEYPAPAGGCLLTDPEFSRRLKDLLDKNSKADENDIELLKIGRHFWEGDVKIIVGRNHEENLKIKGLRENNDILVELKDFQGPTTLIRNHEAISEKVIEKAKELTKFYSAKARDQKAIEYYVS